MDERFEPSHVATGRRLFLSRALVGLPALALLGCGDGTRDSAGGAVSATRDQDAGDSMFRGEGADEELWRRRLAEHVAADNAGDMDALVATLAETVDLVFNGVTTRGAARVAQAHGALLSGFAGYRMDVAQVQVLADGLVVEGTISGTHSGEVAGFPATGRDLVVPYSAIYAFDDRGAIASKRVIANFGLLGWFDAS